MYDGGNALFTPDGKHLVSPVGQRVTVFDLSNESSATLSVQMKSKVSFIAVNPSGSLLFIVDDEGRGQLASLLTYASLSFLSFSEPLTAPPRFSPDGLALAVAVGRKVEIWRVPDFASENRQFAPWHLITRIVQHQAAITSLEWSGVDVGVGHVRRGCIGRWIATASDDLSCRVFKIEYRADRSRALKQLTISKGQIDEEVELVEEFEDVMNVDGKPGSGVHNPLVISSHRHQPILATFQVVVAAAAEEEGVDRQVYLLTLSREGTLFAWQFNEENGRLAAERGQKYRIQINEAESDAEADAENNLGNTSESAPRHNSVASISNKSRPDRWARLRSVAFRHGRLLVGFTDGIFGLFRIDPLLERVDRLYALSLFNSETIGDVLNPGHGIDTCDLDTTGEWLAFGSAKTGQLLVWEWASESYILKQTGVTSGSTLGLTAAAYAPDGQMIATGAGDGKIRLWQGDRGGECIAVFTEHVGPITALAFTKQGHVLVSASQDGSVRAFDVIRFRSFRQLVPPQPVQFSCLAVDASGEVVAAGTLDSNEIFLWSLKTGQLIESFSGHMGPISTLAFEPTRGRLLASGSWDKSVRIWDIYAAPDAKSYCDPFDHDSSVLSLSFRPDGVELSVSVLSGKIMTWSVEGGLVLSTIEGRLDVSSRALSGAAFHSICHSADGSCLLAAGSFPSVALYHLPTRTLLKHFPLGTAIKKQQPSGKGLLQPFLESLQGVAKSVAFCPTGRSWCVLSEEGLLIYGRNDTVLFDPFDLTPDLSPALVESVLAEGKYLQALVYALRLNVPAVIKSVWMQVPLSAVDLLIRQLPQKYLIPMLRALAALANPDSFTASPLPVQRLFTWIDSFMSHHTLALKGNRSAALSYLRILQKASRTQYADMSMLVRSNIYEIDRLSM